LVELETANYAATAGVSEYIRQDKRKLTRFMKEYDAVKTKYLLQKDANLITQKYMTQETATQNIKNQLKSSTENEKMEEYKKKPMHG
jgi:hypothetical protein